jgi:long-subunit acyl-CoA synthetase (AMP-forming)
MDKLAQRLSYHAGRDPRQTAMSDGAATLTRAELAAWAAGAAAALGTHPETIGIAGENSVEWAVAFLAASAAGKTIVPVPAFFSAAQRAHLIHDAGIERIIVTGAANEDYRALPVQAEPLPRQWSAVFPEGTGGGLIIYTSGSSGNPKGVRLMSGQALWTAGALAEASGASSSDRYLSLLPLPMLLEIICGIMMPVLVGGSVHFDTAVAANTGIGAPSRIAEAFAKAQPTASVLVPQLLALYVAQLMATKQLPPEDLRFVAVGGAPLPVTLAATAAKLGIPVYEGYGLSECASVVAVNRPGASRAGTAGQPLPGLGVEIEDGEIIVEGPPVMDGYLRAGASPRRWRTGDMGDIDADGFLTVYGRRDNLIVTPYGRNVNPEWIETMLLDDPRIGTAVLCQPGAAAELTALLIPSAMGEAWFRTASSHDLAGLAAHLCRAAPDYARPRQVQAVSRDSAIAEGLFTPNGRIKRAEAARLVRGLADFPASPVFHETAEALK